MEKEFKQFAEKVKQEQKAYIALYVVIIYFSLQKATVLSVHIVFKSVLNFTRKPGPNLIKLIDLMDRGS